MKRGSLALGCLLSLSAAAQAQDIFAPGVAGAGYSGGGYAAGNYMGPSVGGSEQLFRYDDQERWKHGYIQNMPYYEGFHHFRPYNYHHVFSQSQTAAGWGMSPVLPYSQQFWNKYQSAADLSRGNHAPVTPYEAPIQEWNHYPQRIYPDSTSVIRDSAIPAPNVEWRSPVQQVHGQLPALPAPQ